MAASDFIGRRADLLRLEVHLGAVRQDHAGRLLAVRGRRQAGKSRLLTELVARAGVPSFYYSASRQASADAERARFMHDVAERSTLPGRAAFADAQVGSWEAALRLLANALPPTPSIVVLDEFPWLVDGDPGVEGTVQKLWDTVLERKPLLLVLVGSDLAMMERLTTHGRPLFGRARELIVAPFHPADTAAAIGLRDAAAAFDAQLVTGGYPRLVLECRRARSVERFVRTQLSDENSDLVVVGTRVMAAEFPADLQARRVLAAIGSGERTFGGLQRLAGVQASPLARALDLLRNAKRIVAADTPLSTVPSKDRRYRVDDPYLRFWLRFVEPGVSDIERGRPDLAIARFREGWASYRGRAVEPLVRDAIARLAAGNRALGNAGVVGGYWTRTGDVEIDLVGADQAPVARQIAFVGSVKWRDRAPFDQRDLGELLALRARLPGGAEAPLVAVCRAGTRAAGVDVALAPADLLAAWR